MERVRRNKNLVRLFLDSGAYSAWSRGKEIKLSEYIRYIKENDDYIWQYVNLDVIPGKFGKRNNTQKEIDDSASGSHRNQQLMKDAGLHPIPVFHQGERLHWLETMLKEGEPYIGLSANKFVRIPEQQKWLDMCFSILTNKDGRPYVKTHGFALTAFPLIMCYPWYTVDSTTWSMSPGYGQVIFPSLDNGTLDFTYRTPTRIAISGVTHKSVSSQNMQFEGFSEDGEYNKRITKFLKEHVGIDVTQARYGTNARRRAMLIYYKYLCNSLKDVRYGGPRFSLFGHTYFDTSTLKPLPPFNLILTYATSFNREWSDMLTKVGANDRLLSFWELRTRESEIMHKYVLTGSTGEYKPAKIRQDWESETYLNRRRLALSKRRELLEVGEECA